MLGTGANSVEVLKTAIEQVLDDAAEIERRLEQITRLLALSEYAATRKVSFTISGGAYLRARINDRRAADEFRADVGSVVYVGSIAELLRDAATGAAVRSTVGSIAKLVAEAIQSILVVYSLARALLSSLASSDDGRRILEEVADRFLADPKPVPQEVFISVLARRLGERVHELKPGQVVEYLLRTEPCRVLTALVTTFSTMLASVNLSLNGFKTVKIMDMVYVAPPDHEGMLYRRLPGAFSEFLDAKRYVCDPRFQLDEAFIAARRMVEEAEERLRKRERSIRRGRSRVAESYEEGQSGAPQSTDRQ